MSMSARRPIERYYTSELREVATRQCALVARFDYSYPAEALEA